MEFDIKKVYSAVNAEELKEGDKVICADDLAVLKDLVEQGREGGTIANILDRNTFRFTTNTGEIAAFAYLVERATGKWRPFKDINELEGAWVRKTNIPTVENTMPLIWVRNNIHGSIECISSFCNSNEIILNGWLVSMEALLENYEFLDGTPCGIKERAPNA